MKVIVIYNNHIVDEFADVVNMRQIQRKVSKAIKHHNKEWYWFDKFPMRIRRLIIENDRGIEIVNKKVR